MSLYNIRGDLIYFILRPKILYTNTHVYNLIILMKLFQFYRSKKYTNIILKK